MNFVVARNPDPDSRLPSLAWFDSLPPEIAGSATRPLTCRVEKLKPAAAAGQGRH